MRQNERRWGFRALPRQTVRCFRDQLPRLFKVLQALWVLLNHNLLDNALDDFDDRLRQGQAATPAILPNPPLHEFAMPAADFLTFLAHGVTSQVEFAQAQSNRLSCALASVAVGQTFVFFRFFAAEGGSIR